MKSCFKIILCLSCSLLMIPKSFSYDLLKRYTLMEDRFQTEEMLRPFGHDFLLDTSIWLNTNLQDVVDEAEKAAKTTGDTTAKVNAATLFLQKYNNTEQNARVSINLGVPLPKFRIGKVRFTPDFRVDANIGAMVAIKTQELTLQNLIDLVPQNTPEAIKNIIRGLTTMPAAGADIVQTAVDQLIASDPANTAIYQAMAAPFVGQYYMPSDLIGPNLMAMNKLDIESGVMFNYSYSKFFGYLDLYAVQRRDNRIKFTSENIARDQSFVKTLGKNQQVYANIDYKIGYANKNFETYAVVEDVKLKRVKEQISSGGDLNYKMNPLLRVHTSYIYRTPRISFTPFLGMHKRTYYAFENGVYAGLDMGAHAWKDRMAIILRTMCDPEHLTLSPRIKMWFMQLEYSYKMPIKSKTGDTKVSSIHSADFRMFF